MSESKPPRKSIPLSEDLTNRIEKIANKNHTSFPNTCIELIEIGLKHYTQEQTKYDFLTEIALKNYENILTTANLVAELFKIAKGVPSKRFSDDTTVEHVFDTIQKASKKMAIKKREKMETV